MSGSIAFVLAAVAIAAACGGGGGDGSSGGPAPALDGGVDAAPAPQSLCPNGQAVDYPPAPYDLGVLKTLPPDLAWGGPDGVVRPKELFEPCAAKSRLLVLRTSGAWCGSCIWSITHTNRLFGDPLFAGRVVLVDLLVSDEDNMPATAEAATRWKARIDAPGKVAIDPKYTFQKASFPPNLPLPLYVLVDTRTMQLVGVSGATSPEDLWNIVALELADLDRTPRPNRKVPQLWDGTLTEDQTDMLRAMKLVDAPPADPTNELADSADAAALGKLLFADGQLSTSGVSCAKCHVAAKDFSDGLATSVGVVTVDRHSPNVSQAAHARWQFWDGRADTLWAQALGPPENAKEIASSRLYIAHQIKARYEAQYTTIFGAKYPLPANLDTLPAEGKPGDAAYDAMAQADKDAVTRVYVNVGKAIAAFERSIRVKPNALDAYAGGDTTALTAAQKTALQTYFIGGCAQCHYGPRLTDDAFHVLRFPTGRLDGVPDRGRIDVLPNLASGEFVASSKWSDAPSAAKPLVFAAEPTMLGAFKTATLRGVASTAPYGHGGKFTTLLQVAQHYGTRAKDIGDDKAAGTIEAWVPEFDTNAQTQLVPMLEVLTADPTP